MTATATYNCDHCNAAFTARTADRARGWARFCSKACKASKAPVQADIGDPVADELISREAAMAAVGAIEQRGKGDFKLGKCGYSQAADAAYDALRAVPAQGQPADADRIADLERQLSEARAEEDTWRRACGVAANDLLVARGQLAEAKALPAAPAVKGNYAVAAVAEGPNHIGFRMRLVTAKNPEEAIGIAMRAFDEREPEWRFSKPAVLSVLEDAE